MRVELEVVMECDGVVVGEKEEYKTVGLVCDGAGEGVERDVDVDVGVSGVEARFSGRR